MESTLLRIVCVLVVIGGMSFYVAIVKPRLKNSRRWLEIRLGDDDHLLGRNGTETFVFDHIADPSTADGITPGLRVFFRTSRFYNKRGGETYAAYFLPYVNLAKTELAEENWTGNLYVDDVSRQVLMVVTPESPLYEKATRTLAFDRTEPMRVVLSYRVQQMEDARKAELDNSRIMVVTIAFLLLSFVKPLLDLFSW